MLPQEIKALIKQNQEFLDMLDEYDRTGHAPIEKLRRSFTIKLATYNKLQEKAKASGKTMSQLIDEAFR